MKIKHDKKAKAVYIRFTNNKVAKTVEFYNGVILIDQDKDCGLVGIEILDVTPPKQQRRQ